MPSKKKPGLFARVTTPALPGITLETLMDRRAAAEAALKTADANYGRVALLAEQEAPGASTALLEAQEALILAQAKVRGIMAAQVELEAEDRERRRQEALAFKESRDERSREVFARQAKTMAELEAIIGQYAVKYQEAREADALAQAEWGNNPGLREIELHLIEAVRSEIARVSRSDDFMPPGANVSGACLEGRVDIRPLGQRYADRAKAIFQP